MASGTLAQQVLTANTDTILYTVTTGKVGVLSINFLNTHTATSNVRLAISSTATSGSPAPQTSQYIEYETQIPTNGLLERTGLMVSGSYKIVVRASTANVVVNLYGFEE
tara:strand:- start:1864 stop:2190 length:327 start_codon:yes stop_codon:yes gene_type:complete